MTDKARRVIVWEDHHGLKYEHVADHPNGTHVIVPVEVWLELERENRWMVAKIGDKEYDAMREAMIGGE